MSKIREWIKQGVHKPGKSAPGLAQAITKALKLESPMHRGTIYKMIAGTREVKADELAPISEYIGEPIPLPTPMQSVVGDFITVPIEREIRPGTWFEESGKPGGLGSIMTPRDHNYPHARHHAYLFRGDSMRKSGLLDGDIIICVSPDGDISDGKLVVVERNRSGLVELSVRVVNSYKDRTEYTDDGSAPLVRKTTGKRAKSDVENVNVVAVVRKITRNVK